MMNHFLKLVGMVAVVLLMLVGCDSGDSVVVVGQDGAQSADVDGADVDGADAVQAD